MGKQITNMMDSFSDACTFVITTVFDSMYVLMSCHVVMSCPAMSCLAVMATLAILFFLFPLLISFSYIKVLSSLIIIPLPVFIFASIQNCAEIWLTIAPLVCISGGIYKGGGSPGQLGEWSEQDVDVDGCLRWYDTIRLSIVR